MTDKGKTSGEVIDVAYVAHLARLELTEDERRTFQAQLEGIVGYVRKVTELDVSDVTPTAHGIPVENVFRQDEVQQSLPHSTVMKNAPAQRGGQFLVPKIVE